MDFEQEIALTRRSLQLLLARTRRIGMVRTLEQIVMIYQDNGYHLSDIFQGLADYALQEKINEDPDVHKTWDAVAALLSAAAVEAETRGRELP